MRQATLILIVLVALLGCRTQSYDVDSRGLNYVVLKTPFDPEAGRYVFNGGSAKVSGHVNLQGQVPGKFATVRLMPVTAYTREYLGAMFQGEKAYYSAVSIDNLDPRFSRSMRYAQAGPNGEFSFQTVGEGSFYLYATVADRKSDTYFAVMEQVTVADGQQLTVALDGV